MDPLKIELLQMATIDLDHSFFIQLAIVLALMAVLNTLVFKPFLRSIDLRDAKTVDARRQAEALRARSEQIQADYRTRLAAARADAVALRQTVRVDAGEKKGAIVDAARAKAASDLETARRQSQAQVEGARGALLGEVDVLSKLVVEKILGRGV